MQLFNNILTSLVWLGNCLTLSPLEASELQQYPLNIHSDANIDAHRPSHPIFKPPGGQLEGPDSDFVCEYPSMPDWEECSTPSNRECWLRHPNGTEFNIHTDYEIAQFPVGIHRNYTLIVSDGKIYADGMVFPEAKLFNNQFPGPWIQACWGDTVNITVINQLKYNGTSTHWHGIRQWNSMHMDGVNGITQCPIAPGDYFNYVWNVTQYGSSWYHSHFSVQYADGLQGPITLHGPTSANYDEAKDPTIVTDWGHNSAFDAILQGILNSSILLNGTGDITKFNGRPHSNTSAIPTPYQLVFEKTDITVPTRPKRYLLRVINTSFESSFIFSIDNHWLQIVSADFVPIEPYFNTSLVIGIGQRYNVIVEANPVGEDGINPVPSDLNFWIRTWIPEFCGQSGVGQNYSQTGILRYNQSLSSNPNSTAWPSISNRPCSDEAYGSLKPKLPWYVGDSANGPEGEAFSVHFASKSDPSPSQFPLAFISFDPYSKPGYIPLQISYSNPTFLNLDHTGVWPSEWVVVAENYSSADWVYLALNGTKHPHPIHLHGHDFAIVQQSDEPWSPDLFKPTLDNPPRRDVVLLPSTGFVIAFKTDNPGAWLMHCHIAFHAAGGLALQILERQTDAAHMWPAGSSHIVEAETVCANWDFWQKNCQDWWPGDENGTYPACDPSWNYQDDSGI